MKIRQSGLITCAIILLSACSSNKPVPVAKHDTNTDYAQSTHIHISETNTQPPLSTNKKPANATALCFNGAYSTDSRNPCSYEGGVKEILIPHRTQ